MYELYRINELSNAYKRKSEQKTDIDKRAEFHENQARRYREKSKKLDEDIRQLLHSRRRLSISRYQNTALRERLIQQGMHSHDEEIFQAAIYLEEISVKEVNESVDDDILRLFINIENSVAKNKRWKNPLELIGKLGWKDEESRVVNEYSMF